MRRHIASLTASFAGCLSFHRPDWPKERKKWLPH